MSQHPIQIKMAAERKAKIAKERKRIDAEDKIRFAAEDKRIAAERAWVKEQVEVRQRIEKEQEEMKAKQQHTVESKAKVKSAKLHRKSTAHATYKLGKRIDDDDAFVATVARYLRKDKALSTWPEVLKLMRADGIAGGTKRMARLFPKAQREANGKAKASKK